MGGPGHQRERDRAGVYPDQQHQRPAGRHGAMLFFNASGGQVIVGESGTELLFRLISTAILGAPAGGQVLGSTLEHPASRSACIRWAEIAGKPYVAAAHDDETGSVAHSDYAPHITPDTRVATILHTSPVTGMAVDVGAIASRLSFRSSSCERTGPQHLDHIVLNQDRWYICWQK